MASDGVLQGTGTPFSLQRPPTECFLREAMVTALPMYTEREPPGPASLPQELGYVAGSPFCPLGNAVSPGTCPHTVAWEELFNSRQALSSATADSPQCSSPETFNNRQIQSDSSVVRTPKRQQGRRVILLSPAPHQLLTASGRQGAISSLHLCIFPMYPVHFCLDFCCLWRPVTLDSSDPSW